MMIRPSGGLPATPASFPVVRNDGAVSQEDFSQCFTSIPVINEAASYIAQSTSYFTQCFTADTGDYLPIEDNAGEEVFSSNRNSRPYSNDYRSSFPRWPVLSRDSGDVSNTSFSSNGNEALACETSFQRTNGHVRTAPTFGLSMFQGLVDKAKKTVLGSAEDIGWLQREAEMPPVEDATKRFEELLDNIRNNEHKLPNSLVYLLVPGLFSNHGPLYFVSTKTFFSKMGLTCHIAKIHSEAAVEKNAREIKEYVEEIFWGSGKRVLLLGHSKGGVDAAAALSLYWSDLKEKVAGLAIGQCPYGGSPIASDILREGQLGDYVNLRKLTEILICKVLKGDLQALEDLTYERRKDFLRKHPLPPDLPVVSFHTEASIAPSVLGSLSHVAHAELPRVVDGQSAKLPVVVPLAAAMAACAQALQVRYGEKSDGLVTRRDAEVPGSVVVRPTMKMDHAWMVYSSLNNSGEAESSQVFEALLTLLLEVAQKRRHEVSLKDE